MYQHILVAVDGSDTANLALQEAIKLAKDGKSVVRIVHVVDPALVYAVVEAPYVAGYRKILEAVGQKVVDDGAALLGRAGIRFEAKLLGLAQRGQHIYDVIEEEGRLWPADLIVAGTHGRRGIRRLLLGSVAEGLVRIADRPVLLVPRAAASFTAEKSS